MADDERATLRNSVAYMDDNFPDLVFLVPKHVSREWQATEYNTPEFARVSVYMKRSRDNATLLLDLPSRTLLSLRPRKFAHRLDSGEATCRVRSLLITDQRGRRADIELVLL